VSGRSNKLVGQAGEYLVCAELAKRGFMATPFAGNVPVFDLLIADEHCRSVAIQVKTSTGDRFVTRADHWMDIDFDPVSGKQTLKGPSELDAPGLLVVCVALDRGGRKDRFFVLTTGELQRVVIQHYSEFMEPHGWVRPKKPASMEARYELERLVPHEDRWDRIAERMAV
jgi:hypothetical protein